MPSGGFVRRNAARLAVVLLATAGGGSGVRSLGTARGAERSAAPSAVASRPAEEDVAELDKLSRAISAVAEAVKPSVVNIQSNTSSQGIHALRRFFRDNDLPEIPITGTGSGVILDPQGHIVTNNHVVADADSVRVRLADGREYVAKVVGTDPKTDLAVIKINADHLQPVRWGDSDAVRVGNLVLAIGSPFRLGHSVSHGIISALGRTDVDVDIPYKNWLQTDAPINPGNSGGPLINVHREVIGISVAIATDTGSHQGVGFAIPANTVRRIAERLRRGEKIVRGYLGVAIEPVDDRRASSYGLSQTQGAFVAGVGPKTPAEKGGLKPEDIILSVDDRAVGSREQLQEMIAEAPPGTDLRLHVWRGGKARDLKLKIGTQPEDFSPVGSIEDLTREGRTNPEDAEDAEEPEQSTSERSNPGVSGEAFTELGFEAATLSPKLTKAYRLDPALQGGAVITRVDPTGEAYWSQLRRGYVIVRANEKPIHTVQDLREALSKTAVAKGVRLRVKAGKSTVYTTLRLQ